MGKIGLIRLLTFTLLLIGALAKSEAKPEVKLAHGDAWEQSALRLSGESDRVYRQAISRLKSIPHLNEKLKQALDENSRRTFLALDVISTLKIEALLPKLITSSEKDSSGFFYLAINTFLDATHVQAITTLYLDRLHNRQTSSASKIVLLDTLGRLQVRIPESELQKILNREDEPEVRSAVLYYLRSLWLKNPKNLVCKKCLSPKLSLGPQYETLLSELKVKGIQ